MTAPAITDSNKLFPVFLKLEELSVLIVGGGKVALEKLHAVLQNSPSARIRLVAVSFGAGIKNIAGDHPPVELIRGQYLPAHLNGADLVIVAVNDPEVSGQVRRDARKLKLLVNVADNPLLCDFYLGSVVKKGDLKIAISTNGKSPTVAKRIKEVLNDALPEELDELLNNLHIIRSRLKGDFADKVKKLNKLTKILVERKGSLSQSK